MLPMVAPDKLNVVSLNFEKNSTANKQTPNLLYQMKKNHDIKRSRTKLTKSKSLFEIEEELATLK